MIHFMVDFENVGNRGLQGIEYLNADDALTMFYSQSCTKLQNGFFTQIVKSGAELNICKLHNQGKNGIDFYIASKIGEVLGNGYKGTVAIVSSDKGFRAVQDYWKHCVDGCHNIILKHNIEQCIVSSNENSERRHFIQEKIRYVDIETAYEDYKKKTRIHNELSILFSKEQCKTIIESVTNIMKEDGSKRTIYLNILKHFGRKNGLLIYRRIQELI